MSVRELFQLMVEREASDLYLRTKAFPRMRINGQVEVVSSVAISKQEMIAVTNLLLANEQRRKRFSEDWDIDFIHEEIDVGRFRVNVFMQRGTPSIVARHVSTKIREFEERTSKTCMNVFIILFKNEELLDFTKDFLHP
jgi:Tfp pilus assembly pilus retraction ATPase PilT